MKKLSKILGSILTLSVPLITLTSCTDLNTDQKDKQVNKSELNNQNTEKTSASGSNNATELAKNNEDVTGNVASSEALKMLAKTRLDLEISKKDARLAKYTDGKYQAVKTKLENAFNKALEVKNNQNSQLNELEEAQKELHAALKTALDEAVEIDIQPTASNTNLEKIIEWYKQKSYILDQFSEDIEAFKSIRAKVVAVFDEVKEFLANSTNKTSAEIKALEDKLSSVINEADDARSKVAVEAFLSSFENKTLKLLFKDKEAQTVFMEEATTPYNSNFGTQIHSDNDSGELYVDTSYGRDYVFTDLNASKYGLAIVSGDRVTTRSNKPFRHIVFAYDKQTNTATINLKLLPVSIFDNNPFSTLASDTITISIKLPGVKTNNEAARDENSSSSNTTTDTNSSNNSNIRTENITVNSYEYIYNANDNYYSSLEGKSGQELLTAINKLLASKSSGIGSYNDLKSIYSNTNAFKDLYYEKDNSILDVYSENPNGADPYEYPTYKGGSGREEGTGTNREHLIPQSWFGKAAPMVSDVNHVWPTDIKVNAMRGNYPHDVVTSVSTTSRNGSKLGRNSANQMVFEPINSFKGDISRAYFYFAAAYGNKNITQTANAREVFSPNNLNLNEHYKQVYSKWNKIDPVDKFDITRNNESARSQGGLRNPFIDYPNLLDSIYKNIPFVNRGVLIDARQK
ncbi:endonuclease [Mycoplasma corogypsi]|uniref:endonuclease n=1 Tax=Mycoplasma corogypsi TaxID=2106 RepID=UPI003872C8C7